MSGPDDINPWPDDEDADTPFVIFVLAVVLVVEVIIGRTLGLTAAAVFGLVATVTTVRWWLR